MIQGVAEEVFEWGAEFFEDVAIDFGAFAGNFEADFFAHFCRNIANQAAEVGEDVAEGAEAGVEDFLVEAFGVELVGVDHAIELMQQNAKPGAVSLALGHDDVEGGGLFFGVAGAFAAGVGYGADEAFQTVLDLLHLLL